MLQYEYRYIISIIYIYLVIFFKYLPSITNQNKKRVLLLIYIFNYKL